MSSRKVAPLGQSVPRLMGASGSPSTWTTAGFTFLALSPRVWTITPQETAQYGQMLRVSVVREIFSSRISARADLRSNPSAAAPPTAAAEPFRKVLRFMGHLDVRASLRLGRSACQDGCARYAGHTTTKDFCGVAAAGDAAAAQQTADERSSRLRNYRHYARESLPPHWQDPLSSARFLRALPGNDAPVVPPRTWPLRLGWRFTPATGPPALRFR